MTTFKNCKIFSFILLLLICSCKSHSHNDAYKKTTGELAFLLEYAHKSPSDVGFLTNHVVERRMSNLMKEDYAAFMQATKYEQPIKVDSSRSLIKAEFTDSAQKQTIATVLIDVLQDAFWINYLTNDTAKEFADYPSVQKPSFNTY